MKDTCRYLSVIRHQLKSAWNWACNLLVLRFGNVCQEWASRRGLSLNSTRDARDWLFPSLLDLLRDKAQLFSSTGMSRIAQILGKRQDLKTPHAWILPHSCQWTWGRAFEPKCMIQQTSPRSAIPSTHSQGSTSTPTLTGWRTCRPQIWGPP